MVSDNALWFQTSRIRINRRLGSEHTFDNSEQLEEYLQDNILQVCICS